MLTCLAQPRPLTGQPPAWQQSLRPASPQIASGQGHVPLIFWRPLRGAPHGRCLRAAGWGLPHCPSCPALSRSQLQTCMAD